MNVVGNPALDAFVAEIRDGFVLGQVVVARKGAAFDLRHAADKGTDLKLVPNLKELRERAQFTEQRTFRPLKSAPNLRRGWRFEAASVEELGLALNTLYPGAVADWFIVRSGRGTPTHYREFTARQTGMYRITAMLSDESAAAATRACCDRKFCLKQRLWTAAGLATDDGKEKSAIPCLEPCAIMLEFSRKVMRMEQEERIPLGENIRLSKSEWETLVAALEKARGNDRPPAAQEADFGDALNPRRVELLLNKLRSGMLDER